MVMTDNKVITVLLLQTSIIKKETLTVNRPVERSVHLHLGMRRRIGWRRKNHLLYDFSLLQDRVADCCFLLFLYGERVVVHAQVIFLREVGSCGISKINIVVIYKFPKVTI